MAEQILPVVYRKSAEITPTYSSTDIMAGVGYQIFYAAEGTDVNLLSTTAIFSNEVVKNISIGDLDAFTLKIDQDFDYTFNTSRTISGMSIVSVPLGIKGVTAGGSYQAYIIAKIRKYSAAGVESEISNNQSDTKVVSGTAQSSKVMCIEVDTARTDFGIGDKLRLTIELWAKSASGKDGDAGIGEDPQDRDDPATGRPGPCFAAGEATKLEFHCPFLLDL
jgi:hypothetical protein